MTLDKYQTLMSVVDCGSLTRAAAELGVTQSAVSHSLDSLEKELGFTVIRRSRAGVQLTNEGERLLPAVRSVLAAAEQLNQTASSIRGLESGTVRIGAFTSVAVHWLPPVLKEFQQDYPKVDFKLLNGDYHDVEQWLADGSVDVGFVAMPAGVDCECIPLLEDRLLAILPRHSRFENYPKFPLVECETEPFISLLQSSDHDARRALLYKRRLRRHRHGGAGPGHQHHAGAAAQGPARRSADPPPDPGGQAHHRPCHRGRGAGGPRDQTLCRLCGPLRHPAKSGLKKRTSS